MNCAYARYCTETIIARADDDDRRNVEYDRQDDQMLRVFAAEDIAGGQVFAEEAAPTTLPRTSDVGRNPQRNTVASPPMPAQAGPASWEQYVRAQAPSVPTFSWLFSPLILDAIGHQNRPMFSRPSWWMDWVEAYRATLAPFVRTINVVNRGNGVYYIEAHDQNRLLGYRRVSAQLLNEYGAQARELAIRARDAGLQPANVLPGLAAIARLPATDECERQAEVDLLSGR